MEKEKALGAPQAGPGDEWEAAPDAADDSPSEQAKLDDLEAKKEVIRKLVQEKVEDLRSEKEKLAKEKEAFEQERRGWTSEEKKAAEVPQPVAVEKNTASEKTPPAEIEDDAMGDGGPSVPRPDRDNQEEMQEATQ